MALPEVTTEILDGALGLSQQDLTAISAAVGVSSSGTVNTFELYSRARDVKDTFGTGPLVEKGCYHITRSRKPLYLGRVTASVAGVIGAITKSNVSSPTITASGTVRDTYDVIIETTQTGAVASASGSGAFCYSVDGGDAYSAEIAIPAGGTATAASVTGTVDLTTIDYADAATVTGTGDLSAGALYGGGGTLDGLTVIAEIDNGGSATCTFAAPTDKADALAQLNAAIGDGTNFTAPGNFLVITSTLIGATGEIDITGGTALVALGLVVATTTGDPGDLDGQGFTGTITGVGAVTVSFGAPANAAAAISEINADVGATVATLSGTNHAVLTSTNTGAAAAVTLTAGTALATLGLSAATTNGTSPPGTYTLSTTGMTISFPYGSYTDGDTYTFTTTEPYYSLANLQDMLDVFIADAQSQWFVMHVVGAPASAADCRALADLLDTYATDAEALHRFTWFIMEAPDGVSKTDLKTEFSDFESRRVSVSYGFCEQTSEATRDLSKRVHSRPASWPFVSRLAAIDLSEKAAFVGRGKLDGVVSVEQTLLDEAEEMSDARFIAIREVIGKNGYFIAEDALMAPAGSDFSIGPYRRIMDVACRVTREGLLNYLQGRILVDPDTGYILESVAQAIESDINSRLKSALVSPGHASAASVVVTRDENILSLQSFSVETRVTPPGYARAITHTIGFINPTVT